MVSNHFNRRRANRGTPPICKSKPKSPPPPPPYDTVCKLWAAIDDTTHCISTTVGAWTTLVPPGTILAHSVTCTPGLVAGPPGTIYNCTAQANQDFLGATPGVTYRIRSEVFCGYHRICAKWKDIPA